MKKCLIVVDYQNDFVTGSLGFQEAEMIDSGIAEKINAYHKAGNDVIFTFDTHGENYAESREGKYLPIKHCVPGTNGHMLYGKTAKAREPFDLCFEKSTFGSDKLYEHLKKTRYSSIEFVGVVTNICVISNAVLARTASPETDVTVDARLVVSNDKKLGTAAIDVMRGLQIDIVGADGEDKI